MVYNESADILRMFDTGIRTSGPVRPAALSRRAWPPQIDALNDEHLRRLNNGVYKAGFALTQEAYDEAVAASSTCWTSWRRA